MLVEIAVQSVDGAVTAQRAGADRLEVCSGLEVGGLTPSAGLANAIRRAVRIPFVVMLRPRAGGFVYSRREFDTIRADAEVLGGWRAMPGTRRGKAVGGSAGRCDGFVVGMLRRDGTIDAARCRRLVREFPAAQRVFHRAFDLTPDLFEALEALIEIGFTRVLTSGGRAAASEPAALEALAELVRRAGDRIEVMPGGGIRERNVRRVVLRSGCMQVHSACRKTSGENRPAARQRGPMMAITSFSETGYGETDESQVRRLVRAVRGHA